jgi:hypothetical protein
MTTVRMSQVRDQAPSMRILSSLDLTPSIMKRMSDSKSASKGANTLFSQIKPMLLRESEKKQTELASSFLTPITSGGNKVVITSFKDLSQLTFSNSSDDFHLSKSALKENKELYTIIETIEPFNKHPINIASSVESSLSFTPNLNQKASNHQETYSELQVLHPEVKSVNSNKDEI